ncbi:MAG: hypothetical protein DMG14_13185 [Acidobacteria bacterium]|nr:MAG: hypothetical protein DMG14_13185 [Acidobacteriota bacterium]
MNARRKDGSGTFQARAAVKAGYSSRHFRRIIEEEGIPVMRIGRKFFILNRDLENWQLMHAHSKTEDRTKQVS